MTASYSPGSGESNRPDGSEFSGIGAEQGFHDLAHQTATGAQNLRDAGVLAAMEVRDPTLNPDDLIDRELKIKRLAAELSAERGRSLEDAEAFIRTTYREADEQLAQVMQGRYDTGAAFLEVLGKSAAASLRRYADTSPNAGSRSEKTEGRGARALLGRSKLGKWALGGLVSAGLIAGGVGVANEVHASNQAEFETTQTQIAPVIEGTMININQQTLEQQQSHADNLRVIAHPDGRMDATKLVSKTGNVEVIMGNTDGKPDPNKPLYVYYRNNMGTGKGTNGIKVVLTSPEGNQWVDESMGADFGGDTGDGWAAAGPGADTTDRGYGGNSKPAPLEAAHDVAETVQRFKPYDPYY